MKRFYAVLLFVFLYISSFCQGVINNGAVITVSNGYFVNITGAEGNFKNQSGSVDLSGSLNVEGNWTNNSGPVFTGTDLTDGIVTFSGTGPQSIGGTNETAFENVVVNKSNTLNLSNGSITVLGNFTILSGTFSQAPSTNLNLAGNWTNAGGIFTPGNSTVTLISSPLLSSIINSGGTGIGKQFYNLEISSNNTKTITGNDLIVGNNLTLTSGLLDLGSDRRITITGPLLNLNGGSVVGSSATVNQLVLNGEKTLTGPGGNMNIGVIANNNISINPGCELTMDNANSNFLWTANSGTFSNNGRIIGVNGGEVNIIGNNNLLTSTNNNYSFKNLNYNFSGSLTLDGTIWLSGNFSNNINGSINAGPALVLTLDGNWTNNGNFNSGTSNVKFTGSTPQFISGTAATTFNKLSIYNTSSTGVTLNTSAKVKGQLILNKGYLYSSPTNLLTILDDATVSTDGVNSEPGSQISFVAGTMNKLGNDAFTFPTGDISGGNFVWAPVGIDQLGAVTDEYQAKYNFAPSINNWDPQFMQDSIEHTSGIEYWDVNKINGSTPIQVILWWRDNNRSGISFPGTLRVAHWNAATSKWENMGIGSLVLDGNGIEKGQLGSKIPISDFSPFTFATKSEPYNSLPVELLEFKGKCNGDSRELTWITASELNNKSFSLERSSDGISWTMITTVDGAGNSNMTRYYSYSDKGSYGTVYYRLSQRSTTDVVKYFDPILVDCSMESNKDIVVYPNPCQSVISLNLHNISDENIIVGFYDIVGRLIDRSEYHISSTVNNMVTIDISNLPMGMYYLEAKARDFSKSVKIIKNL